MAIIRVLSRREAAAERKSVLRELKRSLRTEDREEIRSMLNDGMLDDVELASARRLRTLDFLLEKE